MEVPASMTPAARAAAAIAVLDRVLTGEPAEKALTNWGRANRYAGSGDRVAVRDLVYAALRKRRSAAVRGGGLTGRGLVLGLCREDGREGLFSGEGHAPSPPTPDEAGQEPDATEALDVPDWLLPDLRDSLGEALMPTLRAMRERAPVFVRVNRRKTDRAGAMAVLAADGIVAMPHPLAATALEVTENARKLRQSSAFAEGLIELQDAASQAIVEALPLADDMRVLDHCAGGGGKTLAMAGQARLALFAHDIAPRRMADLPPRAARAGVEVTLTDRPEADGPYDLVLVDAPCSGLGSWRRDPEGKWALTAVKLQALVAEQAAILARVAEMVRPGGALAYATCSMLKRENSAQVAAFLATNPSWALERDLVLSPLTGGDGFFLAILRRP